MTLFEVPTRTLPPARYDRYVARIASLATVSEASTRFVTHVGPRFVAVENTHARRLTILHNAREHAVESA